MVRRGVRSMGIRRWEGWDHLTANCRSENSQGLSYPSISISQSRRNKHLDISNCFEAHEQQGHRFHDSMCLLTMASGLNRKTAFIVQNNSLSEYDGDGPL